MSYVSFFRIELPVAVRRHDDESVSVAVGERGEFGTERLSAETVRGWMEEPDAVPDLSGLHPAFARWRGHARGFIILTDPLASDTFRFDRVALDVAGADLAGLDWEAALAPSLDSDHSPLPVVRRSSVVSRVEARPFTLPLRFLEVRDRPGRSTGVVDAAIRAVFGQHAPDDYAPAVMVRQVSWKDLSRPSMPETRPGSAWPTYDVLHVSMWTDDADRALSTAVPDDVRSLGGLARWTALWQTRLVSIGVRTEREAVVARRLGAALVARGGPAVVVGPGAPAGAKGFWSAFYGRIVHDFPLDDAFAFARQPATPVHATLFAGSGREEALRVSRVGLTLLPPARRPGRPKPRDLRFDDLFHRWADTDRDRGKRMRDFDHTLDRLHDGWNTYMFEFHEREGLIPLANEVRSLREAAGATTPVPESTTEAPTPGPRFVNSSFWSLPESSWSFTTTGVPAQLDQGAARLQVGEVYHLGINVGPKDVAVRVAREVALLEEVFKWSPDRPGVWIEIGVTGLDFEVVGDPVQELWLPREGASDTVYFAVVPKVSGVARLRFSIFFDGSVLQSYRVAAITVSRQGWEAAPAVRTRRLARALGLKPSEVGDVGYLPCLEYSLAGIDEIPAERPRALAVVANHVAGRPVITLKGPDLFDVRTNEDLPEFVKNVRAALTDASEARGRYTFGQPGRRNAGAPERLEAALLGLARVGRQLYRAIIPKESRRRLETLLGTGDEPKVIHVAHVLLEKVIPWAVIYDGAYDPDAETDDAGRRLRHTVCRAALPAADGTVGVTECGTHAECVLNPARPLDPRALPVSEETVVCPRHFWGFRHVIEVPPQQVADPTVGAPPMREVVLVGDQTRIAAGLNSAFPLHQQHLQNLDALTQRLKRAALWKSRDFDRHTILKNLDDPALDVVYFYCHAWGNKSATPRVWPPYLEVTGKLGADAFDFDWEHAPLVFLNGCETAGFSPDAVTPFVAAFVEDCGAAGVVGTEISVWEALASEFAELFLERFLEGQKAGYALLEARRVLLAQNNPLGLVYTLYASADLRLKPVGGG